MSDIFVSYSSEDRDRILPLVNALKKTGWSVFWDRITPTGKTWQQAFASEIQGCRSVVVVWTKNSVTSPWVLEEAEIGKSRRILVPVLLDEVEPPFGFRHIQAANLVAWNGDSASPTFSRLIADIAAIRRLEADAQRQAEERVREQEHQRFEEEAKRKADEENRRRIEEERNRAGKFFFSYGRADAEFALKLAADLRSNGTNVWLDQLDIPGGARWDRAVEEALHASPCLLVVLSPASVASNNVMDEVSFGLETDKRIVPILFKDCDIPFRLRRVQYIDFRAGYDDGFKRLVQALKPVDQLPTPPFVKPTPETRRPSEGERGESQPESASVNRRESNLTRKRHPFAAPPLVYGMIAAGLVLVILSLAIWWPKREETQQVEKQELPKESVASALDPRQESQKSLSVDTPPTTHSPTSKGLPRSSTSETVSAVIYSHQLGFTGEDAKTLQRVLEDNGIRARILIHRDPKPPDAIFIGAHVGAKEARIAISSVPYKIKYIFAPRYPAPNYPGTEGGDPSGLLIGIGYLFESLDPWSIELRINVPVVAVYAEDLKYITEPGLSNDEFRRRLTKIYETAPRESAR